MAKVVYASNPIFPQKGIIRKDYAKPMRICDIVNDLQIDRMCVCYINGHYNPDLSELEVCNSTDYVYIQAQVESDDGKKILATVVTIAALVIASVATAGMSSALLAGVVKAGIIVGGSLIAAGIRNSIGNKALEDSTGSNRTTQSPSYSLSAAGNKARPYASLPVVMGFHRQFPDFASLPYVEKFLEEGQVEEVATFVATGGGIPIIDYSAETWVNVGSIPIYDLTTFPPSIICNSPQFSVTSTHWNAFNVALNPFQLLFRVVSFKNIPGQQIYDYYGTGTFIDFEPDLGNGFDLFVTLCLYFCYDDPAIPPDPEKADLLSFGIDTRVNPVIRIEEPGHPNFGQVFDGCEYLNWYLQYVDDNGCPPDWNVINITTDGATPLVPVDITNIPGFRCEIIEFQRSRGYQQVNHHFSYGFGDLRVEDRRFGQTNLRDLRDIKITEMIKTPVAWLLPPLHGIAAPVLKLDTTTNATGYGFTDQNLDLANQIDDSIFTNVNSVDGGQLINNAETFALPNNWIIREGPPNTFRIELVFEGRFFFLNPQTGYEPLTINVEFQRRLRDSGAGGWGPFAGAGSALFTSQGEWVFCQEVEETVPVGQYDIRVRILDTVPPVDEAVVIEMSLSQIKFYQVDPALYPGVHQEFVSVRASEQLSGNLDRMSADVYASCWDWDRVAGAWVWRENSNPASWLLYMIRGGFHNPTAAGADVWPLSPTIGWYNYAGEKDRLETNEYRLFGAGIPEAQIDIECLQNWHEFCDDNNLEFNAIFDNHRTCNEALHLIANVGRASIQWSNSKIGVTYEDPNQLVAAVFTPYNIRAGSFSITMQNGELPDEIQCNYMNGQAGNLDWTQESVFQTRPDLPAGQLPKKRVSIDLFGVTNANQAQRECNLIAAKQSYQRRTVKWKTDAEGLCVVRGDIVIMSHWVTAWDFSSKPCEFITDGTNITGLELDCEVCVPLGFIYVRRPDGEFDGLAASFDGTSVTITDPWPVTQAPGVLDDQDTPNPASLYPDCCPSDWLIMAGPLETPGKKLRVTGITYMGELNNEIEFVAVEEDLAYYAEEFDPGNYMPTESVAKPIIRAENACVTSKDGKVSLIFVLLGTAYAKISYMIDSTGPFQLTYEGNEEFGSEQEYCVDLPVGATIEMTIEPFVIGIPYKVESETITFVVE